MTEKPSTAGASHSEPLSQLWHILASPEMLMALMALLALSLLLASLVPQIPPQAVGDPQAWLAVQRGMFGQRNDLIREIGLFDIYHAWWFQLLLALTGLALTVRLVETAELAWRASGPSRWSAESFAFWGKRAPRARLTSSLPRDDALPRLHEFLVQQRFHWTDVAVAAVPTATASRRRVNLWAQPIAYGALLVALIGLAVMGGGGWQDENWQPAPGEVRPIGHQSSLSLRLDAFEPQAANAGPCDYASTLTWLDNSNEIAQSQVSLGKPATYGGVTAHQVSYALLVQVRGRDSAGQTLALQTSGQESRLAGEIELVFDSPEGQSFVLIPDSDLYLVLTAKPPAAEGRPTLDVSRSRNGGSESELLATLYESGEVAVGDLRLEIEIGYRPILRLDHQPAMWLVMGGLALAVIALTAFWLFPSQLLWLAAESTDDPSTTIHVLTLSNARGDKWWPDLVNQLRGALADDD